MTVKQILFNIKNYKTKATLIHIYIELIISKMISMKEIDEKNATKVNAPRDNVYTIHKIQIHTTK